MINIIYQVRCGYLVVLFAWFLISKHLLTFATTSVIY